MYCNNAILTRIENSVTMYPLTFVQPAYCFTIWLDQVSKIINAAWWFLFTNYKKSSRKENKRSRKSVELWYFYTELAVIMNKWKTIIPLLICFKWLQFKCHEYKVVWLCLQWWIPHTLVWLCHNGLLTLVWLGPLPPLTDVVVLFMDPHPPMWSRFSDGTLNTSARYPRHPHSPGRCPGGRAGDDPGRAAARTDCCREDYSLHHLAVCPVAGDFLQCVLWLRFV